MSNDSSEVVMEKLNALTLVPDSDINQDEIYENIVNKYYKEMKESLDKLSDYKNSLELYHSQYKIDEISNISRNIKTIKKETYFDFNKRKSEIQDLFDKSYDIVNKVNDVKNSKIFKIFYLKENRDNRNNKNIKNDHTITPFDNVYEEFTKFKKLLLEKGADVIKKDSQYSQDYIIKKIKDQYKEDRTIQNELSSLVTGERQNEEEIMVMLNGKNFEKDLHSLFDFFSYFKDNENVNKELEEWTRKCKDFSNVEDTLKMKTVLDELKKEGIYDYKKNIDTKSNYITLFNLFFEKGQALAFLDQHNAEDVKHLYDKLDPNGKDLNMNDISNTINCVGFFQGLKKIEGGLKEIISQIELKLTENNSSLLKGFNNYVEIHLKVIELNENFDFGQTIYMEIKEIIKESKFYFNKNDDEFNVVIRNDDGNAEYRTISFEKIKELKNKIQLKQEGKKDSTSDENSNYRKKYDRLKFFKDLSTNIEEIYELINILRTKGSTLPISIHVDVSYPDVNYYLGQDEKKKDFKDIYDFLSKAKSNIRDKLDSVYKQMTTIRFLYGKQIDSILNHIQGSSKRNSFLRYILNLTDSKEIKEGKKAFKRKTENYIKETNNYNNDSFNIIHDYIISLFDENKSSIKNHYKKISIKEDYQLKGIYAYFSQSDSLEEDILKIFLDKVGKIPIAQNILINSKETSYEEMQEFFHKAILCEDNTLFIVELNGSFSSYQQRCMNIFIDNILTFKNNEFNEKNVDNQVEKSDTSSYMKSCLVFVYNQKGESFINELKKFNPKELRMPDTNISLINNKSRDSVSSLSTIYFPLKEDLYKKTHIIQSEICGLGKSTQIKNKIKESGKKYIYFPLGGNITKDIIYNKLNNIMKDINAKTKKNFEDIAIHLDLFDSKENIVSILNEFLFSFLITKFYSNNVNVIYIPTNIEIYIEIPNSFKDFISSYGILKFFKRDNDIITIENLPELNLPDEKIKLFNNMLGINNNEEIYKWLKEKIMIKRYSYHQIHIFINLFICQYNIFKGQKIRFFENEKDVTDKCIKFFS